MIVYIYTIYSVWGRGRWAEKDFACIQCGYLLKLIKNEFLKGKLHLSRYIYRRSNPTWHSLDANGKVKLAMKEREIISLLIG